MSLPEDFNARIIEEFRSNAGKVGDPFEGTPMLLLHHAGARTGQRRVNPLAYQPVGDSFAVFASKGGSPRHPHWFLNLQAHPETEVEVGSETVGVTARVLEGEARREVWDRQKQLMPVFADYETKASPSREIPVVLLERRP